MIQTCLMPTDVGPALLARLAAFLSEPETQQAGRFRQPQDRRNYIVAHAALRILLARQLGVTPQSLSFATGRWGKPGLAPSDDHSTHFNISHSGDMALIAIASAPVGIDIEQARPLDYASLARHCFAADEAARITDSTSFFDVWTAKEAVVKASGQGLSAKLQEFVVPSPSSALQPIQLLAPDPALKGLYVARIAAANGYHAALSTAHPGLPLQTANLSPSELV